MTKSSFTLNKSTLLDVWQMFWDWLPSSLPSFWKQNSSLIVEWITGGSQDPDTAVINTNFKITVINKYVQENKWQDEQNFTGQFQNKFKNLSENSTLSRCNYWK